MTFEPLCGHVGGLDDLTIETPAETLSLLPYAVMRIDARL